MSNGDKITTQCPNCNSKLAVAALHAGKRLKCPKCQAIVDVPQPAVKADDDLLVCPVVQPPPLDSSATRSTNSQVPPLPQQQRSASKGFSRDFKAVISVIVLSILAAGCLWFYEQWRDKKVERRSILDQAWSTDNLHELRPMSLRAYLDKDWELYDELKRIARIREQERKEDAFRERLLRANRGY